MDNPQQIIETTETIITDMIGHYGWMFIAAFAILLFKNVVSNVLDGLLFMFGHDFDVDDVVYIKGAKQARIVRQNIWKTTFYVFPHERKFVVPNHMLWRLDIEKELPSKKD